MQNCRERFSGKGIRKGEDPEAAPVLVCLQQSKGPGGCKRMRKPGEEGTKKDRRDGGKPAPVRPCSTV